MHISGSAAIRALAICISAAVVAVGLPTPGGAAPVSGSTAAAAGAEVVAGDTNPVKRGVCTPGPRLDDSPDGRPCVSLRLGKKKHARVGAGDTIVLKGTVRHDRARKTVLIQELKGGGRFGVPRRTKGKWKTVERVSHDGTFSLRRKLAWGHHTFRAKVRIATSDGTSLRLGSPSSAPAATASTTATSTTASSTAGSYGYGYVFANDTGHNLKLTYSGAAGTDAKSETVTFDNKTVVVSLLRNPPKNFASGFTLEGKTLGVSHTYKYDGSAGKSPCSKAKQPQLAVGAMAVVVFQNQTFGYKGTVEWPDGTKCTFNMLTSIEDFFKKQGPWAIVLEIAAAVIIIAVIVAVTVVTAGADLPELGEAAAAIGDAVEVGSDVVGDAGELADQISEALDEELPKVTAEDGWPPKYLGQFVDDLGMEWRLLGPW